MKYFIFTLFLCFSTSLLFGQSDVDTIIYDIVEESARFPGCEQLDTTISVKDRCAQQSLLSFMARNMVYPLEARQNNIEGSVVITFTVEKDSTISSPKVVRDIGGGCGEEAMRIVTQMNAVGIRWAPAKNKGKIVRSKFTFPVKFKLEEPLPYVLVDGDTVYSQFDTPLDFKGGGDALSSFLGERLKYPESGTDSCQMGGIDIQLLVLPDGQVRILDLVDYNELGFDFWYEAIDASTSTYGQWVPATYEGRAVPSAYDLSLTFTPKAASCQEKVGLYNQALTLAAEGADLYNKGEQDQGISKMTEAVDLFPENANFLIMRGQAYMDKKEFEAACSDLTKARRIALINWFDTVLPFICNAPEEEAQN